MLALIFLMMISFITIIGSIGLLMGTSDRYIKYAKMIEKILKIISIWMENKNYGNNWCVISCFRKH